METTAFGRSRTAEHPVDVAVEPALTRRNRLTNAFRIILAIPHILLVGGPMAFVFTAATRPEGDPSEWGAGGGVLGAVAAVIAIIAWFSIVFGARFPAGLYDLAVFYMRWRVRAIAYIMLLRDEYPPFGEGAYPAAFALTRPDRRRDRLTVAFRFILVIPQLLTVFVLGVAWLMTTFIGWASIILTGGFPRSLYGFGVGVLRWTTRVEAYILLLHDDYPPFSFD